MDNDLIAAVLTLSACAIAVIAGIATLIMVMRRNERAPVENETIERLSSLREELSPTVPAGSPARHMQERRSASYPLIIYLGSMGQLFVFILFYLSNVTDGTGKQLWKSKADPTFHAWNEATVILMLAFLVAALIYSLGKAAQFRRWGWFVWMIIGSALGFILFSSAATIIFGIGGPTTRNQRGQTRNPGMRII